jgi:hypothetical protein
MQALADAGLTITGGEEVMQGGRVIDQYLATVTRGDRLGCGWSTSTRRPARKVARALEAQGERVVRARVAMTDLVAPRRCRARWSPADERPVRDRVLRGDRSAWWPGSKLACVEFVTKFADNPANPGQSVERIGSLWSARITQELRDHPLQGGRGVGAACTSTTTTPPIAGPSAARAAATRSPASCRSSRWWRPRSRNPRPCVGPGHRRVGAAAGSRTMTTHTCCRSAYRPRGCRRCARSPSDDQLLDVAGHLPDDIADRLLRVAAGELVTPPRPIPATAPLATAAAASSSFVTVTDSSALAAALRQPLDRWLAFLASVAAGAGDARRARPGESHRRRRHRQDRRCAPSRPRAGAPRSPRACSRPSSGRCATTSARNLRKLCTPSELSAQSPSARSTSRRWRWCALSNPRIEPADDPLVAALLDQLAGVHAPTTDRAFRPRRVGRGGRPPGPRHSWAEYRGRAPDRPRTSAGRQPSARRCGPSSVACKMPCVARHRATWSMLCRRAETALATGALASPFDAVIVDEVQDLRPAELRLVRALSRPELVMLCGDAGQRIYPGGFSLGALGIDVRGRGHVLRINYRTTAQIRAKADRILGQRPRTISTEATARARSRARSLLSGPEPTFAGFADRGRRARRRRRPGWHRAARRRPRAVRARRVRAQQPPGRAARRCAARARPGGGPARRR